MRERTFRTVEIDGKKLRAELKKRALIAAEVSNEIGYSGTYIKNACDSGKIRLAAVHSLKSLYNIEYNDIAPNHEPEEAPKQPEKQVGESGIDYEKMYRMIYCAVYEAFKKALTE